MKCVEEICLCLVMCMAVLFKIAGMYHITVLFFIFYQGYYLFNSPPRWNCFWKLHQLKLIFFGQDALLHLGYFESFFIDYCRGHVFLVLFSSFHVIFSTSNEPWKPLKWTCVSAEKVVPDFCERKTPMINFPKKKKNMIERSVVFKMAIGSFFYKCLLLEFEITQ